MLRRWTTVSNRYFIISVFLCALIPIPTARASSSSLVIYQVQTGSASGATQEFISLFNNTASPVDISGWCAIYASSSNATQAQLGCFNPPAQTKLVLPANAHVTLSSNEFIASHSGFMPDIIFTAGMSGTSGHVKIVDAQKVEVDRLGWGSAVNPEGQATPAHATGKILQRNVLTAGGLQDADNNSLDFQQVVLALLPSSGLEEEILPTDICLNIPDIQNQLPDGYLIDSSNSCYLDVCPNLENLQRNLPDGYTLNSESFCELIPLESAVLEITELLPNIAGSDTGGEFVELFNPNNRDISLKGYTLQTGTNFAKSYHLPDVMIASMQYLALSDSQTGLVLPNTTSILRLLAPNNSVVNTTSAYYDSEDDVAWAHYEDAWHRTYTPTPNGPNLITTEKPCDEGETRNLQTGHCLLPETNDDTEFTPCRADQDRNPDTNRCRLLQVAVAGLTACKTGQERNLETNRCRSIELASSNNLVPCKEGQERNPETNRCRTSTQSSVLGACDEGETRNPETNRCRKSSAGESGQLAKVQDVPGGSLARSPKWWLIGASIFAAVGYAVFEWRSEVSTIVRKYIPVKAKS